MQTFPIFWQSAHTQELYNSTLEADVMKKSWRFGFVLTLLVLSAMCWNGSVKASEAAPAGGGKTIKFSIGASSPGGGFYMGASAISSVVNSKLSGYECNVEVTAYLPA